MRKLFIAIVFLPLLLMGMTVSAAEVGMSGYHIPDNVMAVDRTMDTPFIGADVLVSSYHSMELTLLNGIHYSIEEAVLRYMYQETQQLDITAYAVVNPVKGSRPARMSVPL